MAEEKKPAQAEMSLHAGHRQRVRDKVLAGSLDNMADHELIELLLNFRWWDKSVEEINALIPILTCGDLDKVRAALKERLG